jgi:hypothetical protein
MPKRRFVFDPAVGALGVSLISIDEQYTQLKITWEGRKGPGGGRSRPG